VSLAFTLNGRETSVGADPGETLLQVLRTRLGIQSVKEGCVEGECGACTVLLDGEPVDSCLFAAMSVNGRTVTTVEGLAAPDDLHPIQRAMIANGGVQCGFCTPGFIVVLAALLRINPDPSEDDVRAALSGNICRCTGYAQIVDAALATARESK
jgi:carbon-monoxide dehydrogenase small subunit